jgi:hypothetical protein
MSDLSNDTNVPASEPVVTIVPAGVSGLKPPRNLRPANKPAKPAKPEAAAPKQPVISAKDMADPVKRRAFIKAMREYDAAMVALAPRRTKQPIISNAVKACFFANGTWSSEAVAKKTGAKLVTVKTFRGDAVNTLAVMANMPGAWLGADARKWLEVNRKK